MNSRLNTDKRGRVISKVFEGIRNLLKFLNSRQDLFCNHLSLHVEVKNELTLKLSN